MSTTDIGPVEYLLVAFPENRFSGEIVPALADLVSSGTVRILDLAFVTKNADGDVLAFEYEDLEGFGGLGDVDGEVGGLLNTEDLELAADALEPGSSAALLVWEDVWAAPFAHAVRNAGGIILGGERIPHVIVQAALAASEEGETT